jgi:multiple sugar transport system substrate-binding protein
MKTFFMRSAAIGLIVLAAGAANAQDKATLTAWPDAARAPDFEAYEASHPNVDLNIVTVANEELVSKLQLALRAGNEVPDAIFMSDIFHPAMLSNRRTDYLMDLTDKVPKEIQDAYSTNANVPCTINGRLVCLRNDTADLVIWYNKPKMAELGLAVPQTWEEFEALGAKVAALGQGYVIGEGVEPQPLYGLLMAGGCELALPVEGQADTVKINLNTEKCLKPARMIDNLLASGAFSKHGPFDPAFITLAKEGKLLLIYGPTWFGEFVIRPTYEWPAGLLAAALPPRWGDQQQPLTWGWGGGAFGGWKDTKHPDELVDMLIWIATGVEVQGKAATLPAYRPSAEVWGKKVQDDPYYADKGVFDVMLETAAFAHPGYVSLRFSPADSIGKIITPGVASGQKIADLLPALEQELINAAQVAGYTVVQ